ncbi:NAD-dependent epimerase/dehydratase family protein [Nocardioides campestrisoli]|uniref:NAD-dependent epimerase/dehydratase family protein n=1 Tax=Nocardioides campestrisoli TaxID=2736757 RepID=UPI00163DB50C|nr:NAD-dependent epimerase/dehydratase family protein [Nocardioides campestrisoli]
MTPPSLPLPVVVVTGANGLVGSHVCSALSERGATVRAVVRREGTAPRLPGVEEWVGDFTDPDFATTMVEGADSVVTTVHPLDGDAEAQRTVGYDGTLVVAEAALDAGVARLVHLSTAAVYDRRPGVGDVDEHAALATDDAGDYAVIKRDLDLALAGLDGVTRVLLRPPAILGPGDSSVWNTLRPAHIKADEAERHAIPERSFAWVHVDDLTALAADVATGLVADAEDPERGPVVGACTPVNVAAGPATWRDYLGTVTEALGVEPVWEEGPAWTGRILADRAHGWGWEPKVDLPAALAELRDGLV